MSDNPLNAYAAIISLVEVSGTIPESASELGHRKELTCRNDLRGDFPFPLKRKLRASHKQKYYLFAEGEVN